MTNSILEKGNPPDDTAPLPLDIAVRIALPDGTNAPRHRKVRDAGRVVTVMTAAQKWPASCIIGKYQLVRERGRDLATVAIADAVIVYLGGPSPERPMSQHLEGSSTASCGRSDFTSDQCRSVRRFATMEGFALTGR